MSLVNAIAEIEAQTPGLSNEDMLVALKSRTVDKLGLLSGGVLSGLLAANGLLAYVQDTANATGDMSAMRNICVAIDQRLLPDGEIDFSEAGNQSLLGLFLSDATINGILSAQGKTATEIQALILSAATTQEPEFPGIRMVDVVRARA